MPDSETQIINSLNNINIETVQECNLLCKLIMDYMTTDTCTLEVVPTSTTTTPETRTFRISYPEGSFINYKDTSYELTYAYFFYPSRHSIDGERYDLEVNIYHGNFCKNNDCTDSKGLVTHTHYHNDKQGNDDDAYKKTSNQHKHFHYHLPDDGDEVHSNSEGKHTKKNIVTCLLYNKGKHVGNDVNIFFNQFIHHPDFKKLKIDNSAGYENNPKDIKVHDNWSIEQIYPKKRSYFIYDGHKDEDSAENDYNTYVVFDTIQTISKEIIDRLYARGIKNAENFDINEKSEYDITPLTNVMYRKNIEVITDEHYKKIKRAQIKDLLSITRMSTYKPSQRTTKEYNLISQGIVESITGGTSTGYLTDQDKAKRVSDNWEYYGRDKPIELNFQDANTHKMEIVFNNSNIQKYKYVDIMYKHFKEEDHTFYEKKKPVNTNEFTTYLQRKKSVYNLFEIYFSWVIEGKNMSSNSEQTTFDFASKISDDKVVADTEDNRLIRELLKSYDKSIFDIFDKLSQFGTVFFQGSTITEPVNSDIPDCTINESMEDMEDYDREKNIKKCDVYKENGILKMNNVADRYEYTTNGEQKVKDIKQYILDYNSFKGAYTEMDKFTVRFFFEEIDLKWKKKNNITTNIFTRLSSVGRESTISDFFTALNNLDDDFKTKLIFAKQGDTMTRTLSNEECQDWLSNETHYEGSLWKFWEKPLTLNKNNYDWDNLPFEARKKIGEGMIKSVPVGSETKWTTHNECRNPGNRSSAPWCYTKNPNKRWEYCSKPIYSNILGKILLFLIFIFLGIIAFLTIKTFFLHEYPMKLVAKLTGGKFASKETFAGQGTTAGASPPKASMPKPAATAQPK